MGSCGSKSEPRGVPIPRLWSPDSGEPLPPATELRRIATAKADPAVPALERSPTVDIEHRGVALGWIVAFTEAFGLARQPTWWVVEHVIKPAVGETLRRALDGTDSQVGCTLIAP